MRVRSFLDEIRIPQRLNFEEWCRKNISLSSKFAAKTGPFNLALTPYMKFVYSCIDNSQVKKITLMFGSQLGKTQFLLNFMLYRQDMFPGPMMFIMPTIKNAITFSRERAGPMFEDTDVIRRKLFDASGKAVSQTMAIKNLPGGFVMFVGSNSPSDLASTPIRDLLFDETDRYTRDVAGEGSPMKLAMKRTTTFHNTIILESSTPTIKDDSPIEDSFLQGTKFYYHVPCPFCSWKQTLELENLTEEGLECEVCEKKIDDRIFKKFLLDNGEWITKDEKTEHYSFHLSQLYAPYLFVKWADILKDKEEAQEDIEKLKVFTNTVLALTYQEKGESANWKEVMAKTTLDYREGFVPNDTIAITMAVDCQKDHLVFEVRSWQKHMVSHSVEKGIIPGAIGDSDARKDLEAKMEKEYLSYDFQTKHKIDKTLIDCGYDTADVYSFCQMFDRRIISPIKGVDEQPFAISQPVKAVLRRGGKKFTRHGFFFYKVGTSLLKKKIYSTFNMETEDYQNPQSWRKIFYPKSYEKEWFLQLCSEQLITVRNKITNRAKKVWKQLRDRNEALDLAVYNLAAAYLIKVDAVDYNERKKERKKRIKEEEKSKNVAKLTGKKKKRGVDIGL